MFFPLLCRHLFLVATFWFRSLFFHVSPVFWTELCHWKDIWISSDFDAIQMINGKWRLNITIRAILYKSCYWHFECSRDVFREFRWLRETHRVTLRDLKRLWEFHRVRVLVLITCYARWISAYAYMLYIDGR